MVETFGFIAGVAVMIWGSEGKALYVPGFTRWALRPVGASVPGAVIAMLMVQACGLVLVCTAMISVYALVGSAGGRWPAVLLIVPFAVLFAPLFGMVAPDRIGAYKDVRRNLVYEGATTRQARAVAWAAGPLGIAGMALNMTACVALTVG